MLNGYIDVDVKQVAVVLYSPLSLDFVVTQLLLFPFRFNVLILLRPKQVSKLVTLGVLWLTPQVPDADPGLHCKPVCLIANKFYCTNRYSRLEMNSWKVYRGSSHEP